MSAITNEPSDETLGRVATPRKDENAPRSNDFSRYGAVTTKVVTTWLFSGYFPRRSDRYNGQKRKKTSGLNAIGHSHLRIVHSARSGQCPGSRGKAKID